MDIHKLRQTLADRDSIFNPELQNRIDNDELTLDDIKFLEKTISAYALIQVHMTIENILPFVNESAMQLTEVKREGLDLDHDWAIGFVNFAADSFMKIKEFTEDIGLAEITPMEWREHV